jgi:hypothetical protein
MYGLAEYELLTQRNEKDGREGATERPSKGPVRNAERDLTWCGI